MKKIIVFAILALLSLKFTAQSLKEEKSTFYVNVFINNDKDIRVESELVEYKNLSQEVKKRVYNHPFQMDENVIYRIFADENLMLGYIMDVEQKMFDGYKLNTSRERYLLETVEMEIDGPNWLKKLEGMKLDKMKG
jgi:hypothetical protein